MFVECQLRRDLQAICSPVADSCCTADCQTVSADVKKSCGYPEECEEMSFCDGRNSTCPKPPPKADNTLCRSGTRVCIMNSQSSAFFYLL